MNPFEVFGVTPALDLDPRELERRYVALSRRYHPDHAEADAAGGADATLLLERSAALNDAYQTLKDRWSRARAVVDARDPGLLEDTKKLDPRFLAQALERAEGVASATGQAATAMHETISNELEAHWLKLKATVQAGDYRGAATLLHEARYLQKALVDLEEHT